MVELRVYNPDEGFHEEGELSHLAPLMESGDHVVWVHLTAPSDFEVAAVQKHLGLHPITMEDLTAEEDRPRIRFYSNAMSIIFFAVRCDGPSAEHTDFRALRMVLGKGFLVTVVPEEMPELDEAYRRWKEGAGNFEANEEAPLYTILDTLVDSYFPVLDTIADRVDEVEDQVVEGSDPSVRRTIFILKRMLLRFRRISAAGRDVVNGVLRHDEATPDPDAIFLRDVYDHLARVTDSVDTYRDLLGNAMDAYLSVTSNRLAESANRLNSIMQTLASWSIVLGTGAVITGMYGMNVQFPGKEEPSGFYAAIGLMVVAAISLLMFFRRRKWI